MIDSSRPGDLLMELPYPLGGSGGSGGGDSDNLNLESDFSILLESGDDLKLESYVPPSVAMDVVVNFSDGTGALTATKLNNGTHGDDWGAWQEYHEGTPDTPNEYSNIEDHAVQLPFDLLCDSVRYNGSEGKGLTFDLSGEPTEYDAFQITPAASTRTAAVFLMLAKYNTEGGIASYNNDTLNFSGANYTVSQRVHTFADVRGFNSHSEGDNGVLVTDPGDWLIVCGRHNVSGQKGEIFIQNNTTLAILGASQSEHSTPAGDLVYLRLAAYLRGANQGGGDIKVKLLAWRDSDLTWPPYTITVPPPTSVEAEQTDEDELTLTWVNTCQIFKIERNVDAGGWVTLEATYNNNGVDTYTDTDVTEGEAIQYRVTTIIGSQTSSAVVSNTVEVDNGPFADPTFTQNIDPATTDTDETFAAALRQAWTYNGPTGSCVRLGVWCRNFNFAADVKVAIFDSSNNLLGQGVITSTSPTSGSWVDVVVASPFTLNNATAIKTAAIASSAGIQFGYDNGTGSMYYDFSTTYAAFPPNPYTGTDGTSATAAFRIGVI